MVKYHNIRVCYPNPDPNGFFRYETLALIDCSNWNKENFMTNLDKFLYKLKYLIHPTCFKNLIDPDINSSEYHENFWFIELKSPKNEYPGYLEWTKWYYPDIKKNVMDNY
jgi:hypothetical protein